MIKRTESAEKLARRGTGKLPVSSATVIGIYRSYEKEKIRRRSI